MENFQKLTSNYVTIVIIVPETHGNLIREVLFKAGAGKLGNYSRCSYTVKGIGRFIPEKGAHPYIGQEGILEEVIEERIETICSYDVLEHVINEVKKAHPYEEPGIDIYPSYDFTQ